MLRHLVLSISFALFIGTASAAIDSVSVENLNGKKNIVHKVEAKETYYSIARKYNVTPQSVIQFNSNKSLQIGAIIRVPTERPFEESKIINDENKPESNTSAKIAVIDYKVGPREYLLAIAKKFNTTVEDLKTLNNLSSNNLSIGQIIKVPFGSASSEQLAPPPAPPSAPPSSAAFLPPAGSPSLRAAAIVPTQWAVLRVDLFGETTLRLNEKSAPRARVGEGRGRGADDKDDGGGGLVRPAMTTATPKLPAPPPRRRRRRDNASAREVVHSLSLALPC